jgi:hypothetical protein
MAFGQYTNLDFDQIKVSIQDYLRANSNFTDFDFEGSNLSVLINALAYNTYITAYNTNLAVNESFLDSAILRENVVSLVRNIGYVPKSRRAAIAKISFRVNNLSSLTATLKAGIVCNGLSENTTFIFSIPEDVTANVINGVARFDDVEIYEGTFVRTNFTVSQAIYDQKYILPNSFVDTDTIKVLVKSSVDSSVSVEYKQVDNILKIDSQSDIYLIQEVSDERFELLFGDGIIGRKLVDGNYIEVSYITCSGRNGNGASSFNLVGILQDENGDTISPAKISRITTRQASRNGDESESINSIKHFAPRIYASQYRAVTASDYESIIGYIYPNVESVTAYGGEELSPPQFGKVFISVKPRNGDNISESVKRDLLSKLKNYSIAGIVPQFIDAKYLYVEIVSSVYYNNNKNNRVSDLRTLILSSLTQYSNSIDLNKFGGRFKYSKVASLIDNVNYSITSNITSVIIRRNLNAEISLNAQYELCFGNQFHTPKESYNINSTAFKIFGNDKNVYLADRKISADEGELFIFTYEDSKSVIIKRNVGKVNYKTGEIFIDTINIVATRAPNNVIEIQAIPVSNDVVGLKDLYVRFDVGESKISLIRDVISSGENTSGTRLTTQSSYYQPGFIRQL